MSDKDDDTPVEDQETPEGAPETLDESEAAATDTEAPVEAPAEASPDSADETGDADTSAVEFKDLAAEHGADGPELDPDDQHAAQELEPVFDVPVNVQAILGRANIEVSQLLKLGAGSVVELDRKVGEAIDIFVNDRLVARGEVVLVEDHLGVTMTEIIKGEGA